MQKMELNTKCFVCNIKTDEWRSGLCGLMSQHSSTLITVLIRSILGSFQLSRNVDDESNCICSDCLSRIEDCDWQRIAAQRCERELYELLVQTETQCKTEQIGIENPILRACLSVEPLLDASDGTFATLRRRKKNIKEQSVDFEDMSEDVIQEDASDAPDAPDDVDTDNSDNDPSFQCEIEQNSSGDEAFNSSNLVRHTKTRSRTKRQRSSQDKLKSPKKIIKNERKQETEKTYKCTQCGEELRTRDNLRDHEKWHRQEANKLRCPACYYILADQEQFDAHSKLHETVDDLQCVICKEKRVDRAGIRLHMRTHMDIRNFQCHLCGKRFNHAGSLRIHTRYHLNIRPIQCPQCPMTFVEKTHLTRHMRTHTLEKPFACPVCDRRFATKYNMRSHERRHTAGPNANRKFGCSFCGSTFRTNALLATHLQKTHEISTPHHEIPNKLTEMKNN